MFKKIKNFFTILDISQYPNKIDYYDIKLYLEDGTVFFEEEYVNIVHWDNNIYIVYDKDNNFKMRFHKGDNMLLVLKNKIIKERQDEKR